MFDSSSELPKLGDGSVAVLSLDDGGNLNVRQGSGSGWLRIDARPAQLMDLFAAEIGQTREQAQAMGGFLLGQQGFGFEEIDLMVGAAFGFPKQIDALTIVIPTGYEPGASMTVDVELNPKAGTWLGALVGNLQTLPAGAPSLAASGDPMLRMAANIDLAKVMPQLLPVLGLLSGLGQGDKESKAKAAAMNRAFYESWSGSMGLTFDFVQGGKMAAGLANPTRAAELMADPAWVAVSKAAAEANDMAEATIEPGALTHREVAITKQRIVFDDPTMAPFGEDGVMESFSAVAGDLMLATMFAGAKAEMTALIDDVLDQKFKRVRLAGDALMTAHINMGAVMDYLAQQGMTADAAEEAPAAVDLELVRTEKGLKLGVRIQ
jgi:hypothetical protein